MMAKTSSQITTWCSTITDYKKDASNAGDLSSKVLKEIIAETPGHGAEFGPVGENYVITLTTGSEAGTYTIIGVD
jgi:TRAP-type uncharacterized transport system substrate-binding protein